MVRGVAKSWWAGAGTIWVAFVLVLLAATPQARADFASVALGLAGVRAEYAYPESTPEDAPPEDTSSP